MRIDTVLVPLDGSPLAEMALPAATLLLRDSPDAIKDSSLKKVRSRGRTRVARR
jgi:hypothetical protein